MPFPSQKHKVFRSCSFLLYLYLYLYSAIPA